MDFQAILGIAAVAGVALFLFRSKKPKLEQPQEGPLPLRDVSAAEWAELRALEELAGRRREYEKRLARARAALEPPGAGSRGAGDDDPDQDEVN